MTTPIQTMSAAETGGSSASKALGEAGSTLNENVFLKLLVAQLQNQDPLSPVNDQEFMSQMAQFSTVEQVTNLVGSNERLNETAAANQSIALIGHQVTYTKADGTIAEGEVENVDFSGEAPTLTIAGETGIAPGQVSQVR